MKKKAYKGSSPHFEYKGLMMANQNRRNMQPFNYIFIILQQKLCLTKIYTFVYIGLSFLEFFHAYGRMGGQTNRRIDFSRRFAGMQTILKRELGETVLTTEIYAC
jgi:hypothetical protein